MTSGLLHSIARGYFGANRPVYMAVLAYLDASGSLGDPKTPVLSVGGYVAHQDDWGALEPELARANAEAEVPELHMTDFVKRSDAFEKWKGQEWDGVADQYIGSIVDAITGKLAGVPIGASLPQGVFEEANHDYLVEEFTGNAYTFTVMAAIAEAMRWRDERNIREPLIVYVEGGDSGQPDFRRFIQNRVMWDLDIPEPIIIPKGRDKKGRECHPQPLFQVADLVAWSQSRGITDLIQSGVAFSHPAYRSLLERTGTNRPENSYWRSYVMAPQPLAKAISQMRIPRRYNHFVGGLASRKKKFVDPLFYVNGRPVHGYIARDGYIDDDAKDSLDFDDGIDVEASRCPYS